MVRHGFGFSASESSDLAFIRCLWFKPNLTHLIHSCLWSPLREIWIWPSRIVDDPLEWYPGSDRGWRVEVFGCFFIGRRVCRKWFGTCIWGCWQASCWSRWMVVLFLPRLIVIIAPRCVCFHPISPTYPILARWKVPADGTDDVSGPHTWKISPVGTLLGGCSSAGREKCPCSDSGLDLHDRSRSWNSEDQGRLIWVWRNCHVPCEVRVTWLSSARTRRTWAMSGAPWSRHRKFVVLDGLFGTMRRGGATWRVSGVMDVTGGRWKVAVVVELWWCGLEELLCIGRLHGSSQTFFEGYFHLIDHLFRVEGWWSRWWTWCRHRKCKWFRLTRRRCWWCLMDWWRRDRGWLVSLLNWDHHHKIGPEGWKSDLV